MVVLKIIMLVFIVVSGSTVWSKENMTPFLPNSETQNFSYHDNEREFGMYIYIYKLSKTLSKTLHENILKKLYKNKMEKIGLKFKIEKKRTKLNQN